MATILDSAVAAEDPATLKASLDAAQVPTDAWWGKANQFKLTAGAEPGRGFILLRFATLAALDATSDHDLTFLGADEAHTVPLTHITLLKYECISPGSPTDGNAVYLVEVVDRRHFLNMVPVPNGYKGYNVGTADGTAFQTATLNSGVNWTWQTLVTDLATTLGIGTLTLPFTPDGQPENLIYRGSALAALDDVCTRLACCFQYNPTTDTFAVVRLGVDPETPLAAIESSSLFQGRVWDGYSGEFARGWRPEKVRVVFRRLPQPTMTGGETPYFTLDVTLPAAAGVKAGTYVELEDDLPALGATGTPSNTAALTARAAERAADWLRKRAGADRPFVRAWRDFQPGAIAAVGQSVTSVTFDDRGGEMRTWGIAAPDRSQEKWRPLGDYPPWWPFAGGGLTVEEVDGTPSVTGVTKILFDQADGFAVSEVSPGVARIDITIPDEVAAKSCAWLKWVPTTSCWTVYRRGGIGRCSCFAVDDYTDPDIGVIASYVAGLSGWLAVDPLPDTDGAMLPTCCGCGSLLLEIDAMTGVPKLTLGGVHVSCDDDAVFTEVLTAYACGRLPDGRYYVTFFGSSVDVCDGEQAPCRNDYQIMLVCGATCPVAACGCVGCGTTPTPIAWYKLGITGFTDATWNGDWVWVPDPDTSCTWVATCGENTSTLVYVPGVSPLWRLNHGGSVYEIAVSDGQCSAGMTLTRVSGSDSPSTIALTPVQGAGDAPECCGGCDWEALKLKTLYLTIADTGTSLDGGVMSGTYDALNDRFQLDGVWADCACTPTGVRTFLQCVDAQLYLAKDTAHVGPCALSADPDGIISPTSCEPFLATGSINIAPGCGSEPLLFGTFVLSETAP